MGKQLELQLPIAGNPMVCFKDAASTGMLCVSDPNAIQQILFQSLYNMVISGISISWLSLSGADKVIKKLHRNSALFSAGKKKVGKPTRADNLLAASGNEVNPVHCKGSQHMNSSVQLSRKSKWQCSIRRALVEKACRKRKHRKEVSKSCKLLVKLCAKDIKKLLKLIPTYSLDEIKSHGALVWTLS